MVGVLSLDLDGLKMYAGVLKMYAGGLKMYRCPNFVKTKIKKSLQLQLVNYKHFIYYICKGYSNTQTYISPKYKYSPI